MGRYCKVCGRARPNERFGGKGLRAVVCSTCRKLPKEEQQAALWTGEVHGFLEQSNISEKNIKRLAEIEAAGIQPVAGLARLVREVALVRSHKRKRWRYVRQARPELIRQAVDLRLLEDWSPDELGFDPYDDVESFDSMEAHLEHGNRRLDMAAILDSQYASFDSDATSANTRGESSR